MHAFLSANQDDHHSCYSESPLATDGAALWWPVDIAGSKQAVWTRSSSRLPSSTGEMETNKVYVMLLWQLSNYLLVALYWSLWMVSWHVNAISTPPALWWLMTRPRSAAKIAGRLPLTFNHNLVECVGIVAWLFSNCIQYRLVY